jgi:Tol biopolymer transport system component
VDRLLAVAADGRTSPDGATAPGWVPFGPPELVAGLRTELDDIQDPSLTADELEIFFTSPTGGVNDIWASRRTSSDGAWGASALVAELSSSGVVEDPTVSADGLTIYLSSDRAGAGMRLYVARRSARDQPWTAPLPLSDLGPSSADVAPTLDDAGVYLVFASLRGAATDVHLYATSRAGTNDTIDSWGAPVALKAVNSGWQDRDPALFDLARGLVFASRRTDQGKTSDLFHTSRVSVDTDFMAVPARIDELSTDAWEGDPWLSDDGRHIYFMSDRNGSSRIYQARR